MGADAAPRSWKPFILAASYVFYGAADPRFCLLLALVTLVNNLMITMLLGGLWHGAAWGFILWGGLHGAGLGVERLLRGRVSLPAWLRWTIVFHAVVLGWILFRSRNLDLAGTFISRLAEPGPATLWTAPAVLAVIAVVGFQLLPERPLERLRLRLTGLRPVPLGASLALVIAFVDATVPSPGVPPFIYLQF
ncbi:MAG: hypothetical protein ACREX8_03380 [Gammaproteobacteria bacterium]